MKMRPSRKRIGEEMQRCVTMGYPFVSERLALMQYLMWSFTPFFFFGHFLDLI